MSNLQDSLASAWAIVRSDLKDAKVPIGSRFATEIATYMMATKPMQTWQNSIGQWGDKAVEYCAIGAALNDYKVTGMNLTYTQQDGWLVRVYDAPEHHTLRLREGKGKTVTAALAALEDGEL